MAPRKIINDPVHGFITVPDGLLFELMEHRFFQRLRRIAQLGFSHYVYPGAHHTRFHHALGALHLMQQAIQTLRSKGVPISDDEAEAACVAILLHDIGHGPFSHALEGLLVHAHHEELSLAFMAALERELGPKLQLATAIFSGHYPKPFLHQLVSSQLDMDRMDYLIRDTFFTGVSEGVIGYERIIKMLSVHNDVLVVEEKGIYSIEKFLIARKLMYWQAYLHKTAVGTEQLLIQAVKRMRWLIQQGQQVPLSAPLAYFLSQVVTAQYIHQQPEALSWFAQLDDYDVVFALKTAQQHPDFVLAYLCQAIVNRQLFGVTVQHEPFRAEQIQQAVIATANLLQVPIDTARLLVFTDKQSNIPYNREKEEIRILLKSGQIKAASAISDLSLDSKTLTKYYLIAPKARNNKFL